MPLVFKNDMEKRRSDFQPYSTNSTIRNSKLGNEIDLSQPTSGQWPRHAAVVARRWPNISCRSAQDAQIISRLNISFIMAANQNRYHHITTFLPSPKHVSKLNGNPSTIQSNHFKAVTNHYPLQDVNKYGGCFMFYIFITSEVVLACNILPRPHIGRKWISNFSGSRGKGEITSNQHKPNH